MTIGDTTFVLPRELALDPILGDLAGHADQARYFLDRIVRKTMARCWDASRYVRLHSQLLRRVMSSHTLSPIIRALVLRGVVETAQYRVGVRARGYRLASRYGAQKHIRVECTTPRLARRIQIERNRRRTERWLPIHDRLDEAQRLLGVSAKADAILDTLEPALHLVQDALLGNIRCGQTGIVVGRTGRVFNGITNLKRELRSAILLDGDPIAGVDIRCAQPALLALLCRDECAMPQREIERYTAATCEGDVYSLLGEALGLDRVSVKRRFLVDVLAKKGNYRSPVEEAFRRAYPGVHTLIRNINRGDHACLIRQLQRAESQLVIETVAPLLVERIPIVTLHDAIYCQEQHRRHVVDAFRETFDRLNFHPGLSD